MFHPGHVEFLRDVYEVRRQRWLNGSVIVALSTDEAVTRAKGPGRPIYDYESRECMLRAVCHDDFLRVIPCGSEEELAAITKTCQPCLRIVGTDYRGKPVTGAEYAEVVFHDRGEWSTEKLIRRIRDEPA